MAWTTSTVLDGVDGSTIQMARWFVASPQLLVWHPQHGDDDVAWHEMPPERYTSFTDVAASVSVNCAASSGRRQQPTVRLLATVVQIKGGGAAGGGGDGNGGGGGDGGGGDGDGGGVPEIGAAWMRKSSVARPDFEAIWRGRGRLQPWRRLASAIASARRRNKT